MADGAGRAGDEDDAAHPRSPPRWRGPRYSPDGRRLAFLRAEEGGKPQPLGGPVVERSYDWSESYSTGRYVDLLRTHSGHRSLASGDRIRLLAAIASTLDAAGGTYTVPYVTRLNLSATVLRRPSRRHLSQEHCCRPSQNSACRSTW